MTETHDPTDAHAVAGPSRIPPAHTAGAGTTAGGSTVLATPAPSGPASAGGRPGGAPPARRPPPARRADGPVIVPTVIAADGVREVPGAFEHCEVEDLIALIASMLDKLRDHNDRIPLTPNSLTRFHSRAPPNISVRDYLLRIAKFTNVEACCLLILLPYVDKVCARLPTFTVSSLTVHRFIIAAISVGSKALSDAFCTNGRYARVGGVSIVEMNLLEKEFCEALDWRLTTSGPVLAHYYTSLVNAHPQYRLSTARLPSPPPPPPIEIPPPASPLDPLSPVGISHRPASFLSVMDMEVDPASSAAAAPAVPMQRSSPSLPSPSPGPSAASSNVSPSSGSALSISNPHSLAASPERDRGRAPRGPERERSAQDSPAAIPQSQTQMREQQPFAAPPLIPPRFRTASASHLPSPARGAATAGSEAQVNGSALGVAGVAPRSLSRATATEQVPVPSSPAKRPRDHPSGGSSADGAADASALRFHPSPRLSIRVDFAGQAAMDEGR